MSFNLESFMNGVNLGLQALNASQQGIQEVQGGEIQQGASQLVQVAGATAAGATNDPEIQAEATAATQIALVAIPIISDFVNLFRHKAAKKAAVANQAVVDSTAPAASTTQINAAVSTTNTMTQPSGIPVVQG